jgi:hypothetical protein
MNKLLKKAAAALAAEVRYHIDNSRTKPHLPEQERRRRVSMKMSKTTKNNYT